MNQPVKQKCIRAWSLAYDATVVGHEGQELHSTGTVNVERDDLEDAVKAVKKIVPRLHPEHEITAVIVTGATLIVDVAVTEV